MSLQEQSDDPKDLSSLAGIPPISVPTFQSQIPDYLLAQLDDGTKYLIQSMSTQTQTMQWLCHIGVVQNTQLRQLDGKLSVVEKGYTSACSALDERIRSIEEWKRVITGFWPILGALITAGTSIAAIIIAIMEYEKP
jgi:hypothetical protein